MWPYHPGVRHLPMAERLKKWPHLPLIEGNQVINPKVTGKDQEQITTQLTERSVRFIEKNKDKPFFLYVPHPWCICRCMFLINSRARVRPAYSGT